jgi:hypothetical protein
VTYEAIAELESGKGRRSVGVDTFLTELNVDD